MNRFSRKQTLSNFATAVRVIVDSVNKSFFAALLLLAVVSFSGVVHAQAPAPVTVGSGSTINSGGTVTYGGRSAAEEQQLIQWKNDFVQQHCAAEKANTQECSTAMSSVGMSPSNLSGRCDAIMTNIDKLSDRARESCNGVGNTDFKKCVEKVSYCADADTKVSELDEEDEGAGYCDAVLANKCPALNSFMTGRDYKGEKRDAEADRKSAKRDLDDLMDEDRKNKKEIAQQQLDIQEQQQNSAAAFRDAQDKLSKKMEDSLEGIASSSKKAFDDAQTAANQMEVEYVKMRADARTAADAITAAQDQLQTTCRAAAEKKYADAEKARIAAEKKGRQNLGTAISGAAKRKTSTVLRQQAIDYQKYFSECTSGTSAEGVNAKNQIAAAQRAKDSQDKLLADKAALIEKQRAQMQAKLQQMELDATNQKSKVVQDIQQQLNRLSEDKNRTDQQNQQRIALMASNNLQANLSMQNKIATANQELMKTQQEAALAVTRQSCAGRSATKSESLLDKSTKGYTSAIGDIRNLSQACVRAKNNNCSDIPDECAAAATASTAAKSGKVKNSYEPKDGTTKK